MRFGPNRLVFNTATALHGRYESIRIQAEVLANRTKTSIDILVLRNLTFICSQSLEHYHSSSTLLTGMIIFASAR